MGPHRWLWLKPVGRKTKQNDWGWREGSAVKSFHYSSRGPVWFPVPTVGSSQLLITLAPGDPTAFLASGGTHIHMTLSHIDIHTYT